jgi:tetratricopeptide (TPR) repeat protein
MRRRVGRAAVAVLLSVSCATVPRRTPPGDDYIFPTVRIGDLSAAEAQRLRAGWDDLLANRGDAAEETFRSLVNRQPASPTARTALAFARLRLGRLIPAQAGFETVLRDVPDYVPALAGAGAVALRQGRVDDALSYYRRAQALDPNDGRLRSRLAEVKLRVTERAASDARQALERGDSAEAERQYRASLDAAPEVGGLRLELADLLAKQGRNAEAMEVLAADETGDRAVLLRLAELSAQGQDWSAAASAYERLLARDPRDLEAQQGAAQARAALDLSRRPEEYRRIVESARLTRAELAALLDVKVTALARLTPRQPEVAVDISGSWARDHVLRALSLGLIDLYPNHTFQPGAAVRRGDLASAVARVLDLLNWQSGSAPTLVDMSRSNYFYAPAARVVAAGLMDVTPGNAFEPWRPVSGREATDVIDGLARLIGR